MYADCLARNVLYYSYVDDLAGSSIGSMGMEFTSMGMSHANISHAFMIGKFDNKLLPGAHNISAP